MLKDFRFDEPENLWRLFQYRRAECSRVPAFDDHNGAVNESQVGRLQDKRKLSRPRLRIWIEHEKINVVFLVLRPRLADVFAVLPHQKFVQLEVFPDDRFADSAHGERKLQAPTSNFQTNSKSQVSNHSTGKDFWNLELGPFLELGCWCLEFLMRSLAE